MRLQNYNTPESAGKGTGGRAFRLEQAVGRRESRKLSWQRRQPRSVWAGFGFFGLIGWSVVVPTLLGAALGRWLDEINGEGRHWTLILLLAGLTLGCLNAWRWIAREHSAICHEEENRMNHEP